MRPLTIASLLARQGWHIIAAPWHGIDIIAIDPRDRLVFALTGQTADDPRRNQKMRRDMIDWLTDETHWPLREHRQVITAVIRKE